MTEHEDIHESMTGTPEPLVSVIIPTYNRATLLTRSIASVLNQSFQDFEIIVVDDASSDNTEKVVRGVADSRIKYLRHETNRGGAAARNTGIKKARGKYIAFQDSDDEWLPTKLEKQVNALNGTSEKLGAVYTGFWKFQGEEKEYLPDPTHETLEGDIFSELLKGNFITTQAAMVKKHCFETSGIFDDALPRLQDWDLFLRISKHYEFSYVAEPLVKAYYTEDSISSKPEALSKALEIILSKYNHELEHEKETYKNHLIYIFNLYKKEKNIIKCRSYLKKIFRTNHRAGLVPAILFSYFGFNIFSLYWDVTQKVIGKITR